MTENEFEKLMKLCKIECSKDEKKKILHGFEKILSYIDKLSEIDTHGVSLCCHVSDHFSSKRDDTIGELLSRESYLENTPDHVGGMIRVPPVIRSL